ncbi:MAG: methyltransferase [Cycloclasticus sp. symbiont of Bathymodiolus heckerae]|nr:MAG: methyltransferase [Cycloclasticus sp. symbiont of Bathymodiolus heckerae]
MDDTLNKETLTIAHYENNAESFWTGTRDHDVTQNINALINALPQNMALDILDLGCGPGRDLKHFKALGHNPIGLDGSASFCKMATDFSGCVTLNQTFVDMDLTPHSFDGVFANASLFHTPRTELLNVLIKLNDCLRPNGVLFSSNPRGNEEGWRGQRYGYYLEFEAYSDLLKQAGFDVFDHYYRPEGKPIQQQPWLAVLSRRR